MNLKNFLLKTTAGSVLLSASALVVFNCTNALAQTSTATPASSPAVTPSVKPTPASTATPAPMSTSPTKYHGKGSYHGSTYSSLPNPVPRRYASELNLTADQKAKLKEIRKSAHAQLNAVLTPEQKAKIKQARANSERPSDLNLTEEQKAQIKTIRANVRKDSLAVLTPEQRVKLKELIQERKQKVKEIKANPTK
jgi:Spy/CpxP family protein refolding chaperone